MSEVELTFEKGVTPTMAMKKSLHGFDFSNVKTYNSKCISLKLRCYCIKISFQTGTFLICQNHIIN